jgi:hypothetical protein
LATLLVIACTPALLTGCSSDDVMASIGGPAAQTSAGGEATAAPPGPPAPSGQSHEIIVTAQQRAFLDTLTAAGVRPSSELRALSIGSYVCQARAAKQDDRAVWDYVLPLVRNDVRKGGMSAMAPSTTDINTATADYIRIATEQLC